ncbi:hypothetical protein K438DRAFT_1779735 [Mycena galopus ATCC 62051]|nr:hypothetical protein K438DRAFT_1779735 [Mycena galopus ATCC 62051]
MARARTPSSNADLARSRDVLLRARTGTSTSRLVQCFGFGAEKDGNRVGRSSRKTDVHVLAHTLLSPAALFRPQSQPDLPISVSTSSFSSPSPSLTATTSTSALLASGSADEGVNGDRRALFPSYSTVTSQKASLPTPNLSGSPLQCEILDLADRNSGGGTVMGHVHRGYLDLAILAVYNLSTLSPAHLGMQRLFLRTGVLSKQGEITFTNSLSPFAFAPEAIFFFTSSVGNGSSCDGVVSGSR